jgi:hypothetical protein
VVPLTGRPGLPATHVVSPLFEQHHRPVSTDAMPAECVITVPSSTPVWDDAAGKSVYPEPTQIYPGPSDVDGRCRVHRVSDATAATIGDRTLALAAYIVTIPPGSHLVPVNALVTITRCDGDPDLVGAVLQVQGARRSALTWERVLTVQMQQDTAR